MHYTDSQSRALDVSERVGATLSFISLSFVILTFIFSKRFRRPVNRIMFYASLGNLVYTIPGFIALGGPAAGSDSSLCQAQAFFVQAVLPADALWNLSMAMNVYFTVFKANDMARLQQREAWYIGFNTIFPFIVAIILLFISSPDRGRVYGDAAIWCWISSEWEFLRIVTCYGIAWICILWAFGIYIAAGWRIRRERRKLLRPSLEHGQFGETHLATFDIVAQTTVQTTVATEEPLPPQTASSSLGPPKHVSYKPSNRSRYQVHISTSGGRSDAMASSDPVRKYTKSCVLFFISLLITWVPSSINRLWVLAHPGEATPFGLAYTAACVLQLTGFWNSVVYVTMSRRACQELFQLDILPFFRRQETTTQACSRTKSPLIWHSTAGEAHPARTSRRPSHDSIISGPLGSHPSVPTAVKTTSTSSERQTTASAGDSVSSWDWNNKKGMD